MFKLIKIENGHTSAPEIVKMPKSTEFYVEAGTPLVVDGKVVRPAREDDVNFAYMAFADATVKDEYVYCYKIYPNMLFEAFCNDYYVVAGERCTFHSGYEGYHLYGVCSGDSNACEVVDTSDLKRNHTVTVKFIEYDPS